MDITIKFVANGLAARDGCHVRIVEQRDGRLTLTLTSGFAHLDVLSVVEDVDPAELGSYLDYWVDW